MTPAWQKNNCQSDGALTKGDVKVSYTSPAKSQNISYTTKTETLLVYVNVHVEHLQGSKVVEAPSKFKSFFP